MRSERLFITLIIIHDNPILQSQSSDHNNTNHANNPLRQNNPGVKDKTSGCRPHVPEVGVVFDDAKVVRSLPHAVVSQGREAAVDHQGIQVRPLTHHPGGHAAGDVRQFTGAKQVVFIIWRQGGDLLWRAQDAAV